MNSRGTVKYPAHCFRPEDLLTFIELTPFSRLREALDLTDGEFLSLQCAIMLAPKGGNVIPGLNGVRKLRFARHSSSKGKSGSLRCLYKYFEETHKVVLALIYPKSEREDISPDEKKLINKAIKEIESEWGK